MAKRKLSPSEREKIGGTAAARASIESTDRIVRVLVAPFTNEAGEPQVVATSAPTKQPAKGLKG